MQESHRFKLIWPDDPFERIYPFDHERGELIARWLKLLNESGIRYAVAGAYAVHAHTGVWRDSKDFDIFLTPEDLKKALDKFREAYFSPVIHDPCWLAKVEFTPFNLDFIFGFRNRQLKIDRGWFEHSRPVKMMNVETHVLALEELIASKAYIVFRERFDGADVVHLFREAKGRIDWERLLKRMGGNPDLLLWYLIFFLFVYPGHSDYIDQDLMARLFDQLRERGTDIRNPKMFRGLLIDPKSFEVDCALFDYEDRRRERPLVDPGGEAI